MAEKNKPYWRITANLTGRKNWVEQALQQFMTKLDENEKIEVIEHSEVVSLNHNDEANFVGMILMIVRANEEALLGFESPINFISSQLFAAEQTIEEWRRLGWLCCKGQSKVFINKFTRNF